MVAGVITGLVLFSAVMTGAVACLLIDRKTIKREANDASLLASARKREMEYLQKEIDRHHAALRDSEDRRYELLSIASKQVGEIESLKSQLATGTATPGTNVHVVCWSHDASHS